jgi:hypothetical protein
MGKIPWISLQFTSSLIFGINAYTRPCVYQSDKCGTTLATLYGMRTFPDQHGYLKHLK